jgi:hypothetical protein
LIFHTVFRLATAFTLPRAAVNLPQHTHRAAYFRATARALLAAQQPSNNGAAEATPDNFLSLGH